MTTDVSAVPDATKQRTSASTAMDSVPKEVA
jgi:hypothetical protein